MLLLRYPRLRYALAVGYKKNNTGIEQFESKLVQCLLMTVF